MNSQRTFGRHWRKALGPAILGFASLLLSIWLVGTWLRGRVPWPMALLPLLPAAWTAWRLLEWRSFRIVLKGDGRLFCYNSLLGDQTSLSFLFAQVTATQSLMGKLLNYGTLSIQGRERLTFPDIERFDQVRRILEDGRRNEQMVTQPSSDRIIILFPVAIQPQKPANGGSSPSVDAALTSMMAVLEGEFKEVTEPRQEPGRRRTG